MLAKDHLSSIENRNMQGEGVTYIMYMTSYRSNSFALKVYVRLDIQQSEAENDVQVFKRTTQEVLVQAV